VLLALALALGPSQAAAQVVVVLDKSTPADAGLSAGKLAALAQMARGEVARQLPQEARILSEENTMAVLRAVGVDPATCQGDCEVDLGRRLQADLLLSVQLVRFGSPWTLQVNCFETDEGSLLGSARLQAASEAELPALVETGVTQALDRVLALVEAAAAVDTEEQLLDELRSQGLSEEDARAELERAKVGAWASDAKVLINAILNAAKIYEQVTGQWPIDLAVLVQEGYCVVDEETGRSWTFHLEEDLIEAVSTAQMPGGAGQVVQFVLTEGQWRGFGFNLEPYTDGE